MSRYQSRPRAGLMNTTIYSRCSPEEKDILLDKAQQLDRTLSWVVRDALIQSGYLPEGR